PAGSFFGGFRTPALGSAARFNATPASETLHVSGPARLQAGFDPGKRGWRIGRPSPSFLVRAVVAARLPFIQRVPCDLIVHVPPSSLETNTCIDRQDWGVHLCVIGAD